ncbi:MAG TPA: replication-associated recombination protein A, partial [Acidimicrobiales bacterium]|nr:replication-associated recombination protein A [Acidimicrobiales bacterium]
EVNAPLLSRSTLFRLEPLGPDAVRTLIERGLVEEQATADDEAIEHLVAQVGGDGRQVLTALEVAVALAAADPGDSDAEIGLAHVEAALNAKALRYGEDEHYDVISAFIKSIRGSDPDAALYWLALMLESGEDARFIARRLVISASEDIGLADSMGLVVANAAAQAVEFVGLPEARIALAHATVYLAAAPKSNRSYAALGKALADVQDQPRGEVPLHLRGTGYRGAASLGHGEGYDYPHDDPRGWVDQEYRPPGLAGRRYYEPSTQGAERRVAERMAERTSPPKDEESP